jgi:hypothetical protein
VVYFLQEVTLFGTKKALWFYLHVFLQLGGFGVFIAGWIIAFVNLPWQDPPAGAVGAAHVGLGIAVFCLSVIQVIVPKDSASDQLSAFLALTSGGLGATSYAKYVEASCCACLYSSDLV